MLLTKVGYLTGVSSTSLRVSPTRLARRVAGSTWGDRLSRVGLAARGIVYVVLAYLVARIALGALGASQTSNPADGPGVAQAVVRQGGGPFVLAILGVGLVLYAGFSAVDTILHHNDETPAAKRWGDRLLSAWGVVLYLLFAAYCFKTVASDGSGQSSSKTDRQHTQWSASVLRWPAGWLWLGAAGVILLGIAAFLISRAWRRSFAERLHRKKMSPRMWLLAMALGAIGYLGRAALFGLVGWFILGAAIENDPDQGQGVNGAVRLFAQSAAGPYLLWVLAAMLFGYALYLFIETRYRRV